MAAIYSNGGNRWNILGFNFTKRDALSTRLKTHRLFQVDIDRRERCCAANYEQVVNHVVPTQLLQLKNAVTTC